MYVCVYACSFSNICTYLYYTIHVPTRPWIIWFQLFFFDRNFWRTEQFDVISLARLNGSTHHITCWEMKSTEQNYGGKNISLPATKSYIRCLKEWESLINNGRNFQEYDLMHFDSLTPHWQLEFAEPSHFKPSILYYFDWLFKKKKPATIVANTNLLFADSHKSEIQFMKVYKMHTCAHYSYMYYINFSLYSLDLHI